MNDPEIKKALRAALDPIATPDKMPDNVAATSRRRRYGYGSLAALGVVVAVALGLSSLPLDMWSTDPADSEAVVPYERLPLPPSDPDDYPPITPEQQELVPYFMDLPRSVKRGDDIHYVIDLRNPTDNDISLDPCPAYFSSFGESSVAWFDHGYLNCDEAPSAVPANGSVRFEMVLHLTPDLDGLMRFIGDVSWRLEGPDGSSQTASVDSIFGTNVVAVSKGGCLEATDRGGVRDTCKQKTPSDNCPSGIEGEGLEIIQRYPPPPHFEAFNLWRAKANHREGACVVVLAGQQVASEGEEGETTYEPNGYLLILNDYKNDKDGIAKIEVPLPRPIRLYQASGRGYRSSLILQSLEDCSAILFNMSTRNFGPDPGDAASGPCPAD